MIEPIALGQGQAVLHLFCMVTPLADSDAVLRAAEALRSDGPGADAEGDDDTEVVVHEPVRRHQLVTAALLGHKSDVAFLAIGTDLWRMRQFQTDVEAAGLTVVDSYLSLTEVSEYASGLPEERKQQRLNPQLPPEGKRAFCFYPMSKRRGEINNWFTLPYGEREQLMYGHGTTGRTFAGRVLQLVTGSTGIDDYEWGVTLFGVRPDDLKECVYTMRYDEASSLYAEFGPFYTGMVADLPDVLLAVGVR
jgi:chlorite dismutase